MALAAIAAIQRIVGDAGNGDGIEIHHGELDADRRGQALRIRALGRRLQDGMEVRRQQREVRFVAERLEYGEQQRAVHAAGEGQRDPARRQGSQALLQPLDQSLVHDAAPAFAWSNTVLKSTPLASATRLTLSYSG